MSLDEEGDPFGLLDDGGPLLGVEVPPAGEVVDEGRGRAGVQAAELEDADSIPPRNHRRERASSSGEDAAGAFGGDQAEQPQRGGVGPVEVLDDEHVGVRRPSADSHSTTRARVSSRKALESSCGAAYSVVSVIPRSGPRNGAEA